MRPWKLYWCTTASHCEDWFVVARGKREAQRFFERYEGFGRGDAVAELVVRIPAHLSISETHWADEQVLRECGTVQSWDRQRSVEIKGVVYVEGHLDLLLAGIHDDVIESRGRGRPNGTILPVRN